MLKSYPLKVQITVETNQTAKVVVLFVGCLCVHVCVIFFSPVNRNILKYVCDLMPMKGYRDLVVEVAEDVSTGRDQQLGKWG